MYVMRVLPDAVQLLTMFQTCGIVVNGSSSILLENVAVTNSGATLRVNGTTRLTTSLVGQTYVQGHIYRDNNGDVIISNGTFLPYTERGNLVDSSGLYFIKPQPQYTDYPLSAFASVKDAGAKGMLEAAVALFILTRPRRWSDRRHRSTASCASCERELQDHLLPTRRLFDYRHTIRPSGKPHCGRSVEYSECFWRQVR